MMNNTNNTDQHLVKHKHNQAASTLGVFIETYFNKPALSLLLLGFSSGLPSALIASTLTLWLREAGIDRSTVTMFSWAALGYSFKFIWSPLIDTLPVPILKKMLGKRRSWMLASQIMMIVAVLFMAMTNPATTPLYMMAAAAILLGFSSATQDIVIDAYRIECAPASMQTALSATYVAGYRLGMIASGAGALYLADFFGTSMASYNYTAWQNTYVIMAFVMLIGVMTTFWVDEPKVGNQPSSLSNKGDHVRLVAVFIFSVIGFILTYRFVGGVLPSVELKLLNFLLGTLQFVCAVLAFFVVAFGLVRLQFVPQQIVMRAWIEPIADFFRRYGKRALFLLALIGTYRISDVVLGNISNVFYQDLGFSKTQIANAVKTTGLIAAIGGGFIGGWLAQKTSIMKAMTVGAILACLTNLLFIVLLKQPNSLTMYTAVIIDNLAAGLAGSVFVAFLSALTSIRFTAVQYALFSSLMTLSPKILGGYSGTIVDATSYEFFFGFTFVIGLPVLILIYFTNKYIDIQKIDDTPTQVKG